MADPFSDDYNSSDEELPTPAPNPYASMGAKSISKLAERASDLRAITKRNYKTATINIAGAPPTVRQRMLWTNRFKEFCKLMKHKPGQVPTGEDIHRFMDAMVQTTATRYKSVTSLSYSWFQSGVKFAMESCQFDFDKFSYTTQDRMRLKNLVARLENAGAITRDPFREKHWLGCRIIQRCVSALLNDVLENGTLSWDVAICRAATLVLICALGRGGDVVVSSHYAGSQMAKHRALAEMSALETLDSAAAPVTRDSLYNELMCLRYEDIEIKVKEHNGGVSFVAQFIMKQDKAKKQSRKVGNRHVVINSQKDPALNVMDPITYVLTLALRFGIVEGTEIGAVVSNALKRRDKTIQWLKPNYPILPAYGPNNSVALVSKAARCEQALATLRLACELAGILVPVGLHDIRRGHASDIAYNTKVQKLNTQEVAEALGHDDATMRMGVTKEYIGPDRRDNWSATLQHVPMVEDHFGIAMVDAPFKRRKHTAPEVLKKTCEDNGLDYGKRGDRERATKIVRNQDRAEFLQQHSKAIDNSEHPLASIGDADTVLKEKSTNITTKKRKVLSTSAFDKNIDPMLLSSSTASQTLSSDLEQKVAEDAINGALVNADNLAEASNEQALPTEDDHQLLEVADFIHGTGSSLLSSSSENMQALMDPVMEGAEIENVFDAVQINDTDFKQLMLLPTMPFIERLSRINIVRHSQPVGMNMAVGGSRDKPTRFKIPCTNAKFGCTDLWETDEQLRQHLIYCKSTSIEGHASAQIRRAEVAANKASGKWVCDECGKSYASKGALTSHRKDHSWVPKACDVEGCRSKNIFKSASSYVAHHSDAHTWNARNCPFKDSPACKHPAKLFVTRGNFKQHLASSHNLKADEIHQYLQPPASHGTWVPIKCLFPGCISSNEWNTRKSYRDHLYDTHKIHSTKPYMPF